MSAVATVLLAASLAVPLAMLLSCLSSRIRARIAIAAGNCAGPRPAGCASGARGGAGTAAGDVGPAVALDTPGALLLGVAALLWTAGGFYASTWLRGIPDAGRFAVWWLLTLTGSIGVFIAADLVSFYLVFSMVSLAAYGLIIDDGTPSARRNGPIYVALALLGEAFLLMAFVYAGAGRAEPQPADQGRRGGPACISPGAPRPSRCCFLASGRRSASCHATSGCRSPIRLGAHSRGRRPERRRGQGGCHRLHSLFALHAAHARMGRGTDCRRLSPAFYGVAIGITQSNPKTVLAYSSISQMGVIAAVYRHGTCRGR